MDMFADFVDALLNLLALVVFLGIGGLALTTLVFMFFYKRMGRK